MSLRIDWKDSAGAGKKPDAGVEPFRIMLVDDSVIVRERIAAALSAVDGVEIVGQAGDVETACRLLQDKKPDMLVLDIDLPGETGIDLLQRKELDKKSLLISMLTNYNHPKLRERCAELGANFYFHKHAELDKVVDLCRELVARRRRSAVATRPLETMEERYQALFDRSLDMLFVIDLEGNFMDANATALHLLGYEWRDLEGLKVRSILKGEQLAKALEKIKEVIAAGNLQQATEFTLRAKNRRTLVAEVTASLILHEGKPFAIQGIARDVTERKKTDAEIRRVNRLYAVLSQVNQTLIRARSRQELLDQVCRIAVEEGGFQAVMIGWLDPVSMAIQPIATAGGPEDNFQTVRIFADQSRGGQGPTGTAARENKVCVFNNFQDDARAQHWRHLAEAAGVNAVASFPIHFGGAVCGVMSLYDKEKNAFQEKEIALLAAVAENISSGLDRLEQTEWKRQALNSLKESEARYSLLVRETGQVVYEYSIETGMIRWEGAVEEVFGYSREEMRNMDLKRWEESVHPDDRAQTLRALDQAIQRGHRYQIEYRFRRNTGAYIHVEERGSFLCDEYGQAFRMLGTISDISDRKNTEERVREQARLLDLAHDAIVVRDLQDHILYWNDSAERLYGWTAEEALGRKVEELLQQDASTSAEIREAVMTKEEWTGELSHLTKRGEKVLVEARFTLVRDRQGNPKSILSIKSNITDRKKLEAQLLRAQRMESIGMLASGIAHDLNNVLSPIMMSCQLFPSTEAEADRKRLLEMIHASAQRGAELVKQVLSFCRGVEGQRLEIQVGPLVRELNHILEETFPKSITVEANVPRNLWPILADPTQIHQVLLNLCVNARDAMPRGGRLTISVENVLLDNQNLAMPGSETASPHLMLMVSDTGTGIPLEIREKIFDPFFTTKEPDKGTGLGLSTSLAIVKGHGGFINLYSEPERGTCFKVFLPALGTPAAADLKMQEARFPRGNGEIILLVDDEASVRSIANQTLQAFGYQVITATNGAEAIELYAQQGQQIAVVLTDVMMPVMDGPATIRTLSRMNPNIKIITASGLSPETEIISAQPNVVKGFLAKPYTAEALLTILQEVLRGKNDTH